MSAIQVYRGCFIIETPNGYSALGRDAKTIDEAKAIIDESYVSFSKGWIK